MGVPDLLVYDRVYKLMVGGPPEVISKIENGPSTSSQSRYFIYAQINRRLT
jgi:hypothetical protein